MVGRKVRTLVRAPRYTASSRRSTKSGSFCCHSFVSDGFLCWKRRRLRDEREHSRWRGQRERAGSRKGCTREICKKRTEAVEEKGECHRDQERLGLMEGVVGERRTCAV